MVMESLSDVIFEEKPIYLENKIEDGELLEDRYDTLKTVNIQKSSKFLEEYKQPEINKTSKKFLERQEMINSKREFLKTPTTDMSD
mmetsp:Transcript_14328/g.12632  ORF Transcript_14328/g.12632 Transcript_14328/m.12632 type:complete len:86 (+) Transcript_14328:292-549(+)